MKKINMMMVMAALVGLPLSAQDIYKMEMFAGEDLNGTARYVGMGGAMGALGADISTMGSNPAGIGLYRRSDFALSGSVGIQPNGMDFYNRGKSKASFDQIGLVYASPMGSGDLRFVNFGFNYHKRRNLKNFIGVDNFSTGGLSQSLQMLDLTYVNGGFLDLTDDRDREYTTPLTLLGYDTQMLEMQKDADDKVVGYKPSTAQSYNYKRVQWGGVQQYDFNLSINWNDQVYAGMTFGIYNVDINSFTDYAEMIGDNTGNLQEYYMTNQEELSGTGYDLKLGVILRPIEESPFRVGVSVHTPIFFDLKSSQYLYMNSPYQQIDGKGNVIAEYTDKGLDVGDNDYKIRTPWKFNISMATTVGSSLALNAEYEYKNYSSSQVRYPSYYGEDTWSNGDKDEALSSEAKRFLKPVSTVRLGAEIRAARNTYLRLGYNYESAPFSKDAFLNLFTNSSSYYYSANTDYVNLSAINRLTCGLGFRGKRVYADLAYQYQNQSGDLYTFHVPQDNSELNRLSAAKVDLNRHQLMLTLGYKF